LLVPWVGIHKSQLLAVRTHAGPGSKVVYLQDFLRKLDILLAQSGNPRAAV
jgi:hypothetical protein